MIAVDSPLFRGSQWFDCKNVTGTGIPPYGIAEVYGMSTEVIGGTEKPVMLVRVPTLASPCTTVFTGPLGVPAGAAGICHSGDFGYAAFDGSSYSFGDFFGVSQSSSVLGAGSPGFVASGDTFVSSGNSVALFKRLDATFFRIQFTILSANVISGSAIVNVTWRPCCVLRVPEEIGGNVTVSDTMGYFDGELSEELVGRKGTAWYAANALGNCSWIIDGLQCETDEEV